MKYRTVAPQEDGWSDWIVPTDKELRIVCCDCKLAHDFEFKVVNGEVAFRAKRNDFETARLRGRIAAPTKLTADVAVSGLCVDHARSDHSHG